MRSLFSRYGKYSSPFKRIKKGIKFNEDSLLYNLIVKVQETVEHSYNLVVNVAGIEQTFYNLIVKVNEEIIETYNLVVNTREVIYTTYSLVVNVLSESVSSEDVFNLIVNVNEPSVTTYDLVVTVTETGEEDLPCYPLPCLQ